jgi:hypothetical protein
MDAANSCFARFFVRRNVSMARVFFAAIGKKPFSYL